MDIQKEVSKMYPAPGLLEASRVSHEFNYTSASMKSEKVVRLH